MRGRIKHHLKHNLWRADSTILFVGYQAVGTLGRRILDGSKNIRIFGEEIMPHATIEKIEGFSGHADRNGLLEWIGHFPKNVNKVFVMHGEDGVAENFANDLVGLGYDAVAPSLLDTFDTKLLEAGKAAKMEPVKEPADVVDELHRRLSIAADSERDNMEKELRQLLEKWDSTAGQQAL